MIKDIRELNFPENEDGKQYATLNGATAILQDMAESTITAQVKIDGSITPDFSYDWAVEFKGAKYIMPLRQPQAAKENTSLDSIIDLTFQHWAVYQLKRWYFFAVVNLEAGTTLPDNYVYPISLNLGDFCKLFNKVLDYYCKGTIVLDLNPQWKYKLEPTKIEISNSYIWDVLLKFYELYAVRWQIEPNGDIDHYVIKVGYPADNISHIFEYCFEGGLLKVERQVQDENIRNEIIGRGGSKNIPYRYFKQHNDDNASFSPDPDWIPELANTSFTELRGATFRSYIQGWKTKHYGGASITSAELAYAPWAWMRGYTDETFNPVEYVADEFSTGNNGYGVVDNSSIAKYGELQGGLENNEDIYPTIQGVTVDGLGRVDEAVAVEQVISDDVEQAVEGEAVIYNFGGQSKTTEVRDEGEFDIVVTGPSFTVDSGKTGALDVVNPVVIGTYDQIMPAQEGIELTDDKYELKSTNITVRNNATNVAVPSASNIPPGNYRSYVVFTVRMKWVDKPAVVTHIKLTGSYGGAKVIESDNDDSDKWHNTFDIYVKNIWGTAKGDAETYAEYAERVWRPILGDRVGNDAKVIFSDGMLSTSEDYEFTIVKYPEYDTNHSIPIKDAEGNPTTQTYPSHWRITLAKSDADLESLGLYVPSTKRQGKAGDHFYFVGIDMPHQYVVWAEERIDDWKKDELGKVKDIKPQWAVGLDKVRIHNYGNAGALIDQIKAGSSMTLFDKRFIIGGSHQEQLYIQSITYTYHEPTETEANIIPDVEVVLSDKYETVANPVAQLNSEISAIQRQIGSISNVEQIVRAVCDAIYLRKDGVADRSMSPTQFASLLTSADFRSGLVGGAGWGFFIDENGNNTLEVDRLNVRHEMAVNTLVINQTKGQSGTTIDCAAQIEITRVDEADDAYICYFDQRGGSVANLFHVDDVAYSNRYSPDNAELSFYKRRVMAVDVDCITLTKGYEATTLPDGTIDTGVNGSGIPRVGDVVLHYGNYSDANRQYIKVRDIIGGGYERYISNLDSVNASGKEYFFVGRQNGYSPRWFIGDRNADFAEWVNGNLYLMCTLSLNTRIGDTTISNLVNSADFSAYLRAALEQSTVIENGLILTSAILLGLSDSDGTRHTYSGISGLYDSSKPGGGIAAFYGGDMIDKAEYYDWDENTRKWVLKPGADITGLRIATGVDRMDGTGYRAGGNFWWDASGNIYADPMSFIVGENTVGSVLELFRFYPGQNIPFEDILSVYPRKVFSSLRIGTQDGSKYAELTYDSQYNALRINKTVASEGDVVACANFSDITPPTFVTSDVLANYATIEQLNEAIASIPTGGINPEELQQYLAGYVTLDTAQNISGLKTFTKGEATGAFSYNVGIRLTNSSYIGAEWVAAGYSFGIGQHSSGQVHFWSGTPTEAKRYAMIYWQNQKTWHFYGTMQSDYYIADYTTLCTNLNADLLDGRHLNAIIDARTVIPQISVPNLGTAPAGVMAMRGGKPIYDNPDFATVKSHEADLTHVSHFNNVMVYDLSGNGNIVIERINDTLSSANSSGTILRVTVNGAASPGLGGFQQAINSRAGAVFVQVFRALVPANYTLGLRANSIGTGGADVWLTDNKGTGKWEWYARAVYCGKSGTFSSSGYVYLDGEAATAAKPVVWYISHCQVYDLTAGNYSGLRSVFADKLSQPRTLWGKPFDGTADISGDIINAAGGVNIERTNEINCYAGGALYLNYSSALHVIANIGGGNFGIGVPHPSFKLDVNGDIHATGRVYLGDSGAWVYYDAENDVIRCNRTFVSSRDITALGGE